MSGSAAAPRLSRAARAAARHTAREARRSSAPRGVLSIPATPACGLIELRTPLTPDDHATAGAAVRQVGTARRVFLLNPYLTEEELEGLGYYVKTLGRNAGISAVLVGNNDDDDKATLAAPTTVVDADRLDKLCPVDLGQFGPGYGKAWHVSGGYDPLELHEQMGDDPAKVGRVLDRVRDLALACRGGTEVDPATQEVLGKSKVPVISVPHGLVHDGGSAFLLSSYVLATSDTCFRLLNPSRGLALDPTGLSYVLPRSGWEYDQPSADYSFSVAALVGLTGYEAAADDLVEIGLATHFLGEAKRLGILEHALGNLDSWERQTVRPKRKLTMDERQELRERYLDHTTALEEVENNAQFKNRTVAALIMNSTHYDAAGSDLIVGPPPPPRDEREFDGRDPSLTLEDSIQPLFGERGSRLVDLAATFDSILRSPQTADVLEGLREVAASQADSSDPEERECAEAAAELAADMESQSPLAVRVVHRLLQLGASRRETLESCMEREGRAQRNMFKRDDFEYWAEAVRRGKVEEIGEFRGWRHKGVAEVTDDEVAEILEAE